jgi:3-methyladenine DNA glycosylase AlkD
MTHKKKLHNIIYFSNQKRFHVRFLATIVKLQSADLRDLTSDVELKAFWMNIYNTLAFHANLVSCFHLHKVNMATCKRFLRQSSTIKSNY